MRIFPSTHPAAMRALVAAGLGGVVLLTSACSSKTPAQTGQQAEAPAASGGQATRQFNGTFGLIAEIDGTTLQVQGTSEQTAVTYTSSTKFTEQVTGKTSDIKTGDCVSVRSADSSASADSTPSQEITATAVTVVATSGSSCVGTEGGGFGGERRGDFPSGAPTGSMPSTRPSGGYRAGGFPSGARSFGRMVTGKVTAVAGDTLTVAAVRFGEGRDAGSTPSAGATPTTTTTPTTVTLTASTTVTETRATTSSAAKVGLCALAQGSTDSTGAVTAKTIRLSTATNGSCTMEG